MIEKQKDINKHYLFPSTLFVNNESYKIVTILGSCIAVCLYDKRLKIGGINHYMLPLWNGNGLATPKYGNVANKKLLAAMISLGCDKRYLIAKVFGGANQTGGSINIGGRNAQIALDFLEEEGIKIASKSIGGSVGRKIIFDTHTSEVMMKYVKK